MARIAAGAVGARVAFITLRREHHLSIIGCYGIHPKKFDDSWYLGRDLVRAQTMCYVANIHRNPNFTNHPLLKAAPFAKSLAYIPVQGKYSDLEASITIINPELKWPFSVQVWAMLNDLAMLIGDVLKTADQLPYCQAEKSIHRGLHEDKPAKGYALGKDTAGQFLMSTLTPRTSVRNRKDVSYVTLRTWSKAIKEHQISALKIVKIDPDPLFVEAVAGEMAEHVRRLFGEPRVGCVVPVPGGHSRSDECLSVQLARALARNLKVPFVNALSQPPRKGRSHPSKNAALKPPKLVTDQAHEAVLLIDDVATSGRHIELAIHALRSMTQHVTAIAWIGAA